MAHENANNANITNVPTNSFVFYNYQTNPTTTPNYSNTKPSANYGIQKIQSGVLSITPSNQNRVKTSIAGTIFMSVNNSGNLSGDLRIHNGIVPGGISIPPPGTVSHILTMKDPSDPRGFKTPDGWLFCDGTILKKDEYGALYTYIQDVWNVDPNLSSDEFQIPDFRGYFLRCYKNEFISGPFGAGTRKEDTVKKHGHYTIVNPAGGHVHQYWKWENQALAVPPTSAGGVNSYGYRGVYGVYADPTDPGFTAADNITLADPLIVGSGAVPSESKKIYVPGDDAGSITNSTDELTPIPTKAILGENFTQPISTPQVHHHYIKMDENINTINNIDGSVSTKSDGEGVCVNLKIQTFIKY